MLARSVAEIRYFLRSDGSGRLGTALILLGFDIGTLCAEDITMLRPQKSCPVMVIADGFVVITLNMGKEQKTMSKQAKENYRKQQALRDRLNKALVPFHIPSARDFFALVSEGVAR